MLWISINAFETQSHLNPVQILVHSGFNELYCAAFYVKISYVAIFPGETREGHFCQSPDTCRLLLALSFPPMK